MSVKLFTRDQLGSKLLVTMVILVILNTVLVGWSFSNIKGYFPGGATRLNYKREAALDLVEFNRRLAVELGVLDRTAVRGALAGFNYEIELSASSDELSQVILNQARSVQEVILREADAMFVDQILVIINQDEIVRNIVEEKLHLSLHISPEEITAVPDGILQPATLNRIRELANSRRLTAKQVINIEIENGQGRLVVPYNPVEHIQALTDELDKLRVSLHEVRVLAGLAELSGPGIVINLYDELGGITNTSIVHDTDIRDVVNELFASGALGVSVGGQRLTATSAIRCSGPLIKVNDRLIPVNPAVIKAIGEPELLISGLDIIRTTLEVKRGIRFEIKEHETITLPAYVRSAQ